MRNRDTIINIQKIIKKKSTDKMFVIKIYDHIKNWVQFWYITIINLLKIILDINFKIIITKIKNYLFRS